MILRYDPDNRLHVVLFLTYGRAWFCLSFVRCRFDFLV
jgi:hypothetical protein